MAGPGSVSSVTKNFLSACVQMRSACSVAENVAAASALIAEAADQGAQFITTPEMTSLLVTKSDDLFATVRGEEEDEALPAFRALAAEKKIWLLIGSLPIRLSAEKVANRSFLLSPEGSIAARYDKIHMFDVALASGESWRESAAYAPGEDVVTADTPAGRLGLSICYDVRFPALFEALGRRGCDVIAIPAAFTVPTGQAHWHLLQRARAVEASAYVVAAAQVGEHADGRRTYGHSLVVDPWGEVVLDMGGDRPGLAFAELDPRRIAEVRRQLPSLANRRPIPKSA